MKVKIEKLFNHGKEKISNFEYENFINESKVNVSAWAAVLNQDQFLTWLNGIKFDTSIYDTAVDFEYIKSHIGGGNHRLFDGGHSIREMWEKACDASPDDSFNQEVIGYLKALWNDASTVKGLPFKTLEHADYNEWVEKISEIFPSISKKWLYDLTSFDALEITATGIGTVSAILMLNADDKKRFSEIIGSMSVSSIMGANPIMGLTLIALAGYAFFVKKKELDKSAFAKSAGLTMFSSIIFSVLGAPFLIELVVVMACTYLVRKKVLDNEEVLNMMKSQFERIAEKSNAIIISALKAMLTQLEERQKKSA